MTCSRCEAQLWGEGTFAVPERMGRPNGTAKWIRSAFTGNRYCLDFTACDSRAVRKGLLPTRRAA